MFYSICSRYAYLLSLWSSNYCLLPFSSCSLILSLYCITCFFVSKTSASFSISAFFRFSLRHTAFYMHMFRLILILPEFSVSRPNRLTTSALPCSSMNFVRISSSSLWIRIEPPRKKEWISDYRLPLGRHVSTSIL